jgi:hypothetical protein
MTTVINTKLTAAVVTAFTGKVKDLNKLQDAAIQKVVDAMRIACAVPVVEFMGGNAKTNPARGQVAAMFTEIVTAGGLSKSAGANYATSFWIAFETNVPFARTLYEGGRKAKAKATPKAGAAATPKAGAVKTTDRAALDATICKMLQQARLLGLDGFAAEILDVCLERLDGFTEVAAK